MRVLSARGLWLLLLISIALPGCKSIGKPSNSVYIRIQNDTEIQLKDLSLGQAIIKRNSYSHVSYVTSFSLIEPYSMSSYKRTRGKHLGYTRVHFKSGSNQERKSFNFNVSEIIEEDVFSYRDEIAHPYNNNPLPGVALKDGYYTYRIYLLDDQGVFIQVIQNKQ